ncbi:MAG: DoxX family protein [Aurantibacter sp.]
METTLSRAAEILLLLFLIITFCQSGIDKVLDWKGNLSWLKGHFKESLFKNTVPLLLGTILIVEVLAGLLSTIGLVQLLTDGSKTIALYGAITSCIALLMLLFGQRLAKDYVGAQTIVIYFVPAVILVFLLQQ